MLDTTERFELLMTSTNDYRRDYFLKRGKQFELNVLGNNKHVNDPESQSAYIDKVLKPLLATTSPTDRDQLFELAECELLQIRSPCFQSIEHFDTLKYVTKGGGDKISSLCKLNTQYLSQCVSAAYINKSRVRESLFEKLLLVKMNWSTIQENFNEYLNDLIDQNSQELRDLKRDILIVFNQCLNEITKPEFIVEKVKCILMAPARFIREHFDRLGCYFYSHLFSNRHNAFSSNMAMINKYKAECLNEINRANESFRQEIYRFHVDSFSLNTDLYFTYLLIKNHLLLNKFIAIDVNYNIRSITNELPSLIYTIPYYDAIVKVVNISKLFKYEEKYLNMNLIKVVNETSPVVATSDFLVVENCVKDVLLLKYIELFVESYFNAAENKMLVAKRLNATMNGQQDVSFLENMNFFHVRNSESSKSLMTDENELQALVATVNQKLRTELSFIFGDQ